MYILSFSRREREAREDRDSAYIYIATGGVCSICIRGSGE